MRERRERRRVATHQRSRSFDTDALLVMTGLGGLAGTTIQNARLFERLQAAHQRYRDLFKDSIDPMLITDWEGDILEANRQAMLLTGYSSDQLHSLRIDQLHDVDWDRTGPMFETLRENRTCSYESTLHREDTKLPVEVHARRVEFDEADSIQWILRDITERKELDSLRNDLTAMIYHDLRSPLANILSSLDVLYSMAPEKTTWNVTVRSTPSNSGTASGTQLKAAMGRVAGGPFYSNLQWWWQIDFDSGADGWVAQGKLKKVVP